MKGICVDIGTAANPPVGKGPGTLKKCEEVNNFFATYKIIEILGSVYKKMRRSCANLTCVTVVTCFRILGFGLIPLRAM